MDRSTLAVQPGVEKYLFFGHKVSQGSTKCSSLPWQVTVPSPGLIKPRGPADIEHEKLNWKKKKDAGTLIISPVLFLICQGKIPLGSMVQK